MKNRRNWSALHLWFVLVFWTVDKDVCIAPAEIPEHRVQEIRPSTLPSCPSKCHCHQQLYRITTDCSSAQLQIVPAGIHNQTQDLQLYNNKLTNLSYSEALSKLEILNASENNIAHINTTWLRSMNSLKSLDLSYNALHSENIRGVFTGMQLYSLDLSNNRLKKITFDVLQEASSLKELDLSANEIDMIENDSFPSLVSLEFLNLTSNRLPFLKHDWFKPLKVLRSLYLGKNKLKMLSNIVFWPLNSLKHLDLSQNMLDSVGLLSFKGLFKLETLNMSNNRIPVLQEGTFKPLEHIKIIDLSSNPFKTLDRSLKYATSLKILYARNMSKLEKLLPHSFSGTTKLETLDLSGSKSLSIVSQHAFTGLKNLKHLDVSECGIHTLMRGTFKDLSTVESLKLTGNFWKCDCYMYWLLHWFGEHLQTPLLSPSETLCHYPDLLNGTVLLDALDHFMVCTNASIIRYTENAKFRVGSTAILQCQGDGTPEPSLTWITPRSLTLPWQRFKNSSRTRETSTLIPRISPQTQTTEAIDMAYKSRFMLMRNGDLLIRDIERGDGGFYTCVATNAVGNDSIAIRLILDYEYLNHIKIMSILVGLATSFGFLLLTLVSVLVETILKCCGVKCPCRNGRTSPKSQQIRKILESMEHYKRQQLDRLRENYNSQVQRIKDNCMQQMERLRESYSSQAERLRDIRDYGTLQIDRIRENYYLQVHRVREYSFSQIERLRENYIFQRNRIRKFSTNHLYKLRENYKLQQQHLNKILENLNIESCRNVCQRTDSMVFEPDITLENVFVPKICLGQTFAKHNLDSVDNSSQLSAYFTPDDARSEASEILENPPSPPAYRAEDDHAVATTSSIPNLSYDASSPRVVIMNDSKLTTLNSNETTV